MVGFFGAWERACCGGLGGAGKHAEESWDCGRSVFWCELEGSEDRVLDFWKKIWPCTARRNERVNLVENCCSDPFHAGRGKFAGKHAIESGAKSIDIGGWPVAGWVGGHLLWRGVGSFED